MKQLSTLKQLSLLILFLSVFSGYLSAQCNVNEKYDKVVSGYHSSIALKNDGSFALWGQDINNAGTGDVLSPVNMNSSAFSALAGTPLKATIGGQGGGGKDQYILLTSSGLFAWGTRGYVLASGLTTSATFQKIGAITGGDATTRLPSGVAPEDVAQLVASYQTLALLTTGGNVWILTQAGANIQGDGTAAATTTWHQVKKDASTVLGNVTAIRLQVSSSSLNACMALTSAGEVYAWGSTVYLGNGSAASAKNYATAMTLPAEFSSSNIPKMIGVTGGIKNTSTVKNTFYLVSNLGSLYALGDNTKRQCATFNTTEQKSWVNCKINSSTNFSNVQYISVQEHNGSYPGVAAILSTGDLYTWGENDGLMLGRATDGSSYDPGIPGGFNAGTDKAVSCELGGHTLVYLREGSAQFCYVGHKVSGSMGDGTATDTNVNTFNCTGTPSISICGYVPVAASTTTSTIAVSSPLIIANGLSTSIITIRLKDASGNNLTTSGGTVIISSSAGVVGTVIDNNDGTYTAILTSSSDPATANISFSINGTTAEGTTNVVFSSSLPVKWGDVKAYRKYKTQVVEWIAEQAINVSHFSVERSLNGADWKQVADQVKVQAGEWPHAYSFTDQDYQHDKVYYRIKEWDLDGKFSYSSILRLDADAGYNRIIAYPSPTNRVLYIGNVEKSKLSTISLYALSGELVKNWTQAQDSYDLSNLSPGIYILKISLSDGSMQTIRVKKI